MLADEPTGNLDSANAAMVMELLLGLHWGGETALVLVTLRRRSRAACPRCIRVKDGEIVEDRAVADTEPKG